MIDALPFLAELLQSWRVTLSQNALEVAPLPVHVGRSTSSGVVFVYRHDGTPKSLGEAISRAYAGSAPDSRRSLGSEDF